MNKLILAATILGAGAAGFLTAHRAAARLQHQASLTEAAWRAQTRLISAELDAQAELRARRRELSSALAQPPAATNNPLWSALRESEPDNLPPELRQRLLEELGFNWQSSDEYVVVSKAAVRDLQPQALQDGKLTETMAALLTLTPAEREEVDSTVQRVQTEFNTWALAHTQRTEPHDEVVAQYTLEGDPAIRSSLSNALADGVLEALGLDRAQFILPSARNWLISLVRNLDEPLTMIVTSHTTQNGQNLKAQFIYGYGTAHPVGNITPTDLSECRFPKGFLPRFPNGWADVAKRESFQLPENHPPLAEQKGATP